MRLGRKKEVRIKNRGEAGDPDGRERAQRCERHRKKSSKHSKIRKGERKRLRERERDPVTREGAHRRKQCMERLRENGLRKVESDEINNREITRRRK